MNQFAPDHFFNIDLHSSIKPLFSQIKLVWNIIPLIPSFIEDTIKPAHLGTIEDGAWIEPNNVFLGPGSHVERGAIIRGPTIIGANTLVRSGAYIRGHVITGEHCMIGAGTEIRNTVLLNYSNIPHQNLIFSSLIGSHVNIGGQTILANRRLDDGEVSIHIELEHEIKSYPTGMNRFGAVIGDYTEIGAQSLLNPGAIVGSSCVIYPHVCGGGYLPSKTILKATSESVWKNKHEQ